jgi:hypothetical protein
MSFVPSPNQSGVETALRLFLLGVLPTGIEIIAGQDNRVSEPIGADFVVMTPIRRRRIETNVDTFGDCVFTGSISGTILTAGPPSWGTIVVGNLLWGPNVALPSTITGLGTGTGGAGTYIVSSSQSVASQIMACGVQYDLQPTEITVQLDVHGPNSADNAETISTLFRDDFGYQQFLASGYNVWPLDADDPRQIPFLNAEQQYETRWIVEAKLQANQIVNPPQQYMSQVDVDLEEVK